jgi:hypothetical protein
MSKVVAEFGPYQAVAVKGRLAVFKSGRFECQWLKSSPEFKAPLGALKARVHWLAVAKAERAARVAYGRERKAAARLAAAAGPEQLKLF